MATGLTWCDIIVWSPSHILIHRIYPDEEWITQTSQALHEFYHSYLTRPEDTYQVRDTIHWCNIDLNHIFYMDDARYSRLREIFTETLAMHLSRWIVPCRVSQISRTKWMNLIKDEFDKALAKRCRRCLLKLFRMKSNESLYVDDNEPIKRIANPNSKSLCLLLSLRRNTWSP